MIGLTGNFLDMDIVGSFEDVSFLFEDDTSSVFVFPLIWEIKGVESRDFFDISMLFSFFFFSLIIVDWDIGNGKADGVDGTFLLIKSDFLDGDVSSFDVSNRAFNLSLLIETPEIMSFVHFVFSFWVSFSLCPGVINEFAMCGMLSETVKKYIHLEKWLLQPKMKQIKSKVSNILYHLSWW